MTLRRTSTDGSSRAWRSRASSSSLIFRPRQHCRHGADGQSLPECPEQQLPLLARRLLAGDQLGQGLRLLRQREPGQCGRRLLAHFGIGVLGPGQDGVEASVVDAEGRRSDHADADGRILPAPHPLQHGFERRLVVQREQHEGRPLPDARLRLAQTPLHLGVKRHFLRHFSGPCRLRGGGRSDRPASRGQYKAHQDHTHEWQPFSNAKPTLPIRLHPASAAYGPAWMGKRQCYCMAAASSI